jgi:hypothetical protein
MKRRHLILGSVSAIALVVGGVAPSAIGTTTTSSTQHFLIVQTSETGNPPVIATGPIHARGTDVQVNNRRDRFVFPGGVLRIRHHATTSRESFDPTTCLGRFSESGTFTIIDGTKAYKNVTGSGTYHVRGYFIGCTEGDPSNVVSIVITASGTVSGV